MAYCPVYFQLIKRRGKLGLVKVNVDWAGAVAWIKEKQGSTVSVGAVSGALHRFIVSPFVPHSDADEYYVAILGCNEGDCIMFTNEGTAICPITFINCIALNFVFLGGVDVGDVDAKALTVTVPTALNSADEILSDEAANSLLVNVPENRRPVRANGTISTRRTFCTHMCILHICTYVLFSGTGALHPRLAPDLCTTALYLPRDQPARHDGHRHSARPRPCRQD